MKISNRLNARSLTNTQLLVVGALIIFLFTSANAIFYSIKFAFGYTIGTYVYYGDLFADLFKVILSYPYSNHVIESGYSNFPDFIKSYIDNNPYKGFDGLGRGELTHFHLPPLTTAIAFILIKLLSMFGLPFFSGFLLITSLFFLSFSVKIAVQGSKSLDVILLLLIASYPLLFIIQRGNFFSFFATLSTIFSIVALKRGRVFLSILFMALAVNVRPNLLVFLPIFYFTPSENVIRPAFLVAFSIVTFVLSLCAVNLFYPEYSFESFLTGLATYKSMYVYGDGGFAYSTSLYTFLKYICKLTGLYFQPNVLSAFVSFISLPAIFFYTVLYRKKLISFGEFVLLLATLGMLFTHVFADYHLLIFVLPLLLLLDDRSNSNNCSEISSARKIYSLIFCVIMLAPMNYFHSKGVYVLPFIKTLAALFVCIYIPTCAIVKKRVFGEL